MYKTSAEIQADKTNQNYALSPYLLYKPNRQIGGLHKMTKLVRPTNDGVAWLKAGGHGEIRARVLPPFLADGQATFCEQSFKLKRKKGRTKGIKEWPYYLALGLTDTAWQGEEDCGEHDTRKDTRKKMGGETGRRKQTRRSSSSNRQNREK
ncbi:hypothetical protein AAFF_G00165030 [Aldrovandia affinis]|uniref:Uncharacterized protein n=1 Tax=Aldrovandia affinis TaxID=143900 RepID=A0AAD7W7B2_9TELE|nr:hypothetical protein AAFF_G00165030 [Aldrovandia affinis]